MKKTNLISTILIATCLATTLTVLTTANKAASVNAATKHEIFTIQPVYSDIKEYKNDVIPLPTGVYYEPDLVIKSASYIVKNLDTCTYPEENKSMNTPISKEIIQSFKPNSIIYFQGHGNYFEEEDGSSIDHSILDTNRDILPEDEQDEDYKDDLANGRIVEVFALHNEGITSKYIDKYCPDITGSVIYLGQCHSGHDEVLAQSFINKGASCVFGNTLDVQMRYGDIMQYEVMKRLADINPKTNDFYTASEALETAKSLYGKTDKEKYPTSSNGDEVVLFGDANFRLNVVASQASKIAAAILIPVCFAGCLAALITLFIIKKRRSR